MKSFIKSLITALLLLFSVSAFAQTGPEDIVRKFFNDYKTSPALAIENIYATNDWTSQAKDAIETMKNEVNRYTVNYIGKYYGQTLITQKKLADCLVLYSYVVKYDRQPIRFIFEFYKPNDKWMLYSMKIDSNLDDEMEQSAKLVYLSPEKN